MQCVYTLDMVDADYEKRLLEARKELSTPQPKYTAEQIATHRRGLYKQKRVNSNARFCVVHPLIRKRSIYIRTPQELGNQFVSVGEVCPFCAQGVMGLNTMLYPVEAK